jgi:hypothetical protein
VVTSGIVLAGVIAGIVALTRTPDLPRVTPPGTAAPAPGAVSHVPKPATADTDTKIRSSAVVTKVTSTATPEKAERSAIAHHLTPDNIAAVVRSEYATGLQRCYERYARDNRNAPRKLVVTLILYNPDPGPFKPTPTIAKGVAFAFSF